MANKILVNSQGKVIVNGAGKLLTITVQPARTITWDGDTTGKEVINIEGDFSLYKVSTATPSIADCLGGVIEITVRSTTSATVWSRTITDDPEEYGKHFETMALMSADWDNAFGEVTSGDPTKAPFVAAGSGMFIIVALAAQTLTIGEGEEAFDIVIPSTGTYFLKTGSDEIWYTSKLAPNGN